MRMFPMRIDGAKVFCYFVRAGEKSANMGEEQEEFRTDMGWISYKNSSQHTQKWYPDNACLLSTEYKYGRLSTIISSVPNVEYFSTERWVLQYRTLSTPVPTIEYANANCWLPKYSQGKYWRKKRRNAQKETQLFKERNVALIEKIRSFAWKEKKRNFI